MRAAVVLALALAVIPAGADADRPRWVRCCIALDIPDLPPGPVCAQVRGRRGVRPRRACRLLGGRPMGRGDCSLALCREPA
ncbi:MAG TPA: hypothetical protein VKA21_06375 [Candidatus Binatia bacterium]|nr:hypothetical protein [Candidatus Binatia bacterium]